MTNRRFVSFRRTIAHAVVLLAVLALVSCMSTRSDADAHSPQVVAHRGGAGLAPENTMAAFATGLEHDPDAVELDVHLSRDGRLVVIHDSTLIRTTGRPGSVEDYPYSELREFDASARYFGSSFGPQPIPTIEDVLDLVTGRAGVQVEIKLRADGTRYEGIEAAVVRALREADMVEHAVVISFDFPTLVAIQALEPRLATGALIGTRYMNSAGAAGPAAVADELAALGVTYAGVDRRWLSDNLYAALRSAGLRIGVWTVNERDEIRKFVAMGVDFITSDRPDVVRRIVPR